MVNIQSPTAEMRRGKKRRKKEERKKELEMWANAQRDGRRAEYRWHSLFNAAKVWLTPTTKLPCSNAAKTRNPLKLPLTTYHLWH